MTQQNVWHAQNGGEPPSKKRGKKKKGDGAREIEKVYSAKDILCLLVRLRLAAACRFTAEVRLGLFMSGGLGPADY